MKKSLPKSLQKALDKASEGKSVSTPANQGHAYLRHVKVGDTFIGIYLAEKVHYKVASNGSTYSDLVLRDKSGSRFVRFWGKAKATRGDYVRISANVDTYNDKPQIVAQVVEAVEPPTDLSYYIASTGTEERDAEQLKGVLATVGTLCKEIGDDTCAVLLGSVFTDGFTKTFCEAPGSAQALYGRRGGLLAHTVRSTTALNVLGAEYQLCAHEKVVLLTAGLLHYVGAVHAYVIEAGIPSMTVLGHLYGAKYLSLRVLDKALASLTDKNLDEDTVRRVVHCILSQGECPKAVTKEALLLSEVVNSDVRLTENFEYIEQDDNEGNFTAYDTYSKREFYKPRNKEEGK